MYRPGEGRHEVLLNAKRLPERLGRLGRIAGLLFQQAEIAISECQIVSEPRHVSVVGDKPLLGGDSVAIGGTGFRRVAHLRQKPSDVVLADGDFGQVPSVRRLLAVQLLEERSARRYAERACCAPPSCSRIAPILK